MARKNKKNSKDSLNHDKWPLEALNEKQQEYIDAIEDHQLVFSVGYPGTAKTLIAIYMAYCFYDDRNSPISKIVVIRNLCDASGSKSIGALPGTLEEKTLPMMQSIYDNMSVFMTEGRIEYVKSKNQIEFVPYEYLRGRTFEDAFIIVEEGQNFTTEQMYSIITRIGDRSKMVVNGDYMTQRDLQSRYGVSGLQEAVNKLKDVQSINFVLFDKLEYIVRSGIVKDIIMAYYGGESYDFK